MGGTQEVDATVMSIVEFVVLGCPVGMSASTLAQDLDCSARVSRPRRPRGPQSPAVPAATVPGSGDLRSSPVARSGDLATTVAAVNGPEYAFGPRFVRAARGAIRLVRVRFLG
jgi:hypothetical protein